ncbi:hypothetical protein BC828DRAFT_190954 [Blastocladiella britannica]|nr:hypothetical protein BC828DRAFT_190954 [Blastocladiella britannica]
MTSDSILFSRSARALSMQALGESSAVLNEAQDILGNKKIAFSSSTPAPDQPHSDLVIPNAPIPCGRQARKIMNASTTTPSTYPTQGLPLTLPFVPRSSPSSPSPSSTSNESGNNGVVLVSFVLEMACTPFSGECAWPVCSPLPAIRSGKYQPNSTVVAASPRLY